MMSNKFIFAPTRTVFGGVGTYTREFLNEFGDFTLATGPQNEFLMTEKMVRIDGFDSRPTARLFYSLFKVFRGKRTGVFIYQGTLSLFAFLFLRVLCPRVRHIIVFHGLASKYSFRVIYYLERICAALASHNVFLTDSDKTALQVTRNCSVISNFTKREPAPEARFESNVFSTVTRNTAQKNLGYSIKEFSGSAFRLAVYGVGKEDYSGQIESNIDLCGLVSPNIPYEEKFAFVLSTYSEGFPLSVLEAASRGLPLILSDIPELREVCGEHALYFSNDNPGDLRNKILLLKGDKALHSTLVRSSIELAQAYSYGKWCQNWKALLEEVEISNE